MAAIRRCGPRQGAAAVQIAQCVGARRRIVTQIGSAHTEAELGVLLQRARDLLADPAQGALDLGVEPAPQAAGLVGPAGSPGLFDAAPAAALGLRDGPGRVVSTDSRVLYEGLAGALADPGQGCQ